MPPPPPSVDTLRDLRTWQRFHVRIATLFAVVVFAVITAGSVAAYQEASRQSRQQLGEQMEVVASTYARGIDPQKLRAAQADPAHPFRQELRTWFAHTRDARISSIYVLFHDDDPSQLRFFTDWVRTEDASIPAAATADETYDGSGMAEMLRGFTQTVHEAEMVEDAWGLSFSAYSPVRSADGTPFALVGVDVQAADVQALQDRVLWLTVLAWALGAATVALASWMVGRNVRAPLARVIEATGAIAQGRFDTRLEIERDDEFGLMASHFDRMASGLAEREVIRETFGRYVTPAVASKLLADGAHLGGTEVEVTVLFTDLRSYSTVSEALSPDRLIELSNTYLGRMQEAIDEEEGTVIEFLGDAILAVFGAPTPQSDHAERAVRCALAMRSLLAELNAEARASGLAGLWQEAGVDTLAHRVGIHTGRVVAGNIGSRTRMKYAVIGDSVNIAARLEQLNKQHGTEVLLSGATRGRLSEGMRDRLTGLGRMAVKGRSEPVEVFQV